MFPNTESIRIVFLETNILPNFELVEEVQMGVLYKVKNAIII